jgi:hypothetical protein
MRETAFVKLQSSLAAKDLQLAELQQMHSSLLAEVAELRRTSRREGCNMDYLKNVVLQVRNLQSKLLVFPPGSLTLCAAAGVYCYAVHDISHHFYGESVAGAGDRNAAAVQREGDGRS